MRKVGLCVRPPPSLKPRAFPHSGTDHLLKNFPSESKTCMRLFRGSATYILFLPRATADGLAVNALRQFPNSDLAKRQRVCEAEIERVCEAEIERDQAAVFSTTALD
jgi:hypothetical protein